MATTGKTNAKHIRVSIEDNTPTVRDISASVSSITGVGLTYQEQDVHGYSDGIINFTLGHPSSEIEISGPIDNTADIGAHIVFAAIEGDQTTPHELVVDFGIRAAPATGDPEFKGDYYCSSYIINGDGTYTARLVPAGITVLPQWTTKPA